MFHPYLIFAGKAKYLSEWSTLQLPSMYVSYVRLDSMSLKSIYSISQQLQVSIITVKYNVVSTSYSSLQTFTAEIRLG